MKIYHTTYIAKVLNDGHLSLDDKAKQNLDLKEGDQLQVTLKKIEIDQDIIADEQLSIEATEYLNYRIGSGIKGENLKNIIGEIKKVDQRYQEMPKDDLIKKAFDIAEQRAQAWYQKHGLKRGQLSEDELLDTINKIRDSD